MKQHFSPIAFFCFCVFCFIIGEILILLFLPKQNATEYVVPTPQSIIQALPYKGVKK